MREENQKLFHSFPVSLDKRSIKYIKHKIKIIIELINDSM